MVLLIFLVVIFQFTCCLPSLKFLNEDGLNRPLQLYENDGKGREKVEGKSRDFKSDLRNFLETIPLWDPNASMGPIDIFR